MSTVIKSGIRSYKLVRGGLDLVLRVPTHDDVVNRTMLEIVSRTIVKMGTNDFSGMKPEIILASLQKKNQALIDVVISKIKDILKETPTVNAQIPSQEELIESLFKSNEIKGKVAVSYDGKNYDFFIEVPNVGGDDSSQDRYDAGFAMSKILYAIGDDAKSKNTSKEWIDKIKALPQVVVDCINDSYMELYNRATVTLLDPGNLGDGLENF